MKKEKKMVVKGIIGGDVYVKAKISKIVIEESGVKYYVAPYAKDDNSVCQIIEEDNIRFPEPVEFEQSEIKKDPVESGLCEIKKDEKIVKKAQDVIDKAKKRGRPPKGEKPAKLESLAHKAEVARSQIEE